jgi:hypothetical protein
MRGGFEVALDELEERLRTMVPEEYRDRTDVRPEAMGSAGLRFWADGRVAWDEMWSSFCDLAMAGGPPHKSTLLEPGTEQEVAGNPGRSRQVVEEICRGIGLSCGLDAEPSPRPGWVRVRCTSWGMAEWLVRAITMENVAVRRCEGGTIDLPAGPEYRLEREIKNVITVIAKTSHYWDGHMPAAQRHAITALFRRLEAESPLLQPAFAHTGGDAENGRQLCAWMVEALRERTGLEASERGSGGWVGVLCPDVSSALWMMRRMVASNTLSRREERTVFLPADRANEPGAAVTVERMVRIHQLAKERGLL